jgi:hypothetical protein
MRPNILSSLICTIQTHVGFTRDLNELQAMRNDIVSSREAIKPSVVDGIRQKREAKAAMYDALIGLIDVKIAKYERLGERWRKAKFSIVGGQEYEGYHWGNRWNGWACPMFTIEVMQQIADDLGGEYLKVEGDTVIHIGPEEEDCYRDTGTLRERDGIPTMRLYSFDGWCWEEVEGGE